MKIVYQTLEDRFTDLDKLENEGPYPCKWENSWLGDGYYFWDTFIENAHWWGREIRKYTNGYIICEAICDFNDERCCDLVGNTDHLSQLVRSYEEMVKNGLADESTKVRRIIEHLRTSVKTFNFEAVRAYGIKSKSYNSRFSFIRYFEDKEHAFMDFKPAYQICFYSKRALNLRNYRIVFPENYSQDEVV